MNLPFGLLAVKEPGIKKRDEMLDTALLFEKKLVEYQETLEGYRKFIKESGEKREEGKHNAVEEQLEAN